MRSALARTDDFLRATGPFSLSHLGHERPGWWLPVMILAFSPVYGAVMGSFHFDAPARTWQVVFSASKMPLLLFATRVLCLPGFFVLNTILGLRDDFREATQAILAGQAGLSIALASLAPFTRFWYCSTTSYRSAHVFNAAMFTVAAIAGQIVMFRYYRGLISRHRYHRIMLCAWLALYAFVGIQMGWVLRPFIGAPGLKPTFFREEAFGNAYVVVARLILGTS